MENSDKTKPKKKSSAATDCKSTNQSAAGDKLTAIRELLFGEQVGQLNQDMSDSVKRLEAQINALEKTLEKQVTAIHQSIQQHTAELREQLEKSDCEHQSTETILEQNLEKLTQNHEALVNETDNRFAALQKSLDQQRTELDQEIRQQVEKLTALIDQRASELGNNKADRKTLAALLESVAST